MIGALDAYIERGSEPAATPKPPSSNTPEVFYNRQRRYSRRISGTSASECRHDHGSSRIIEEPVEPGATSDDRNDKAGTAWVEGLFRCDDGKWIEPYNPGHQQDKGQRYDNVRQPVELTGRGIGYLTSVGF